MPYPRDFIALRNFKLAWERILRGNNGQYKRHFRHLFPSYSIASDSILRDLISRLQKGHYQPSRAVTVYFPKPSKVLRPITLISLNDQVVYQAIANYIANRFFRSLRPYYGRRTFGALFAGSGSKFFYRPWKTAYRQFSRAVRSSYFSGNNVLADFDLVSFYDLIDHKILRRVLAEKVRDREVLDLLFECLSRWTSGNPSAYIKGHGIPQGPEPSAFLAEIIMRNFDRAQYGNVTYLRYVDDIKLLGTDFSSVRRALIRLDLQSKRVGLVPQAQKIEVRKVTNINDEIKTIPSAIAGAAGRARSQRLSKGTIKRLRRLLGSSLVRSKGELKVAKETHFKFALHRLPASKSVLRRVEPLFQLRPDLSGVLSQFASRFPNDRRAAKLLYKTLGSDPVFDASAGDYVLALDCCVPKPEPKKYLKIVARLQRQSEEKSLLLGVPANFYLYKRSTKSYVLRSVQTEPSPLSASQLINMLALDANHACMKALDLLPAIRSFANSSPNEDLSRYCTYLMLSELKMRPGAPRAAGALVLRHLGWAGRVVRESLLTSFFRDVFGLPCGVDWPQILGKTAHSELQRRSVVLRGLWDGGPTVLITALDSFNDLLIQRLSLKDKLLKTPFKKAAGKNKIPDYGFWLAHNALRIRLPKAVPPLNDCHQLRVRADLAHATHKKTGRFTRPISYREKDELIRRLKPAFSELLQAFAAV